MRRLFSLGINKLRVLFGGKLWLFPVTLLLAALAFFAVRCAVTAKCSETVGLSAVDECGGAHSSRLVNELENAPGFTVIRAADTESAKDDIASGRTEAILVIHEDFDARAGDDGASGLISLYMAPGSVSADLIRETVSGKLISVRAEMRAKAELVSQGFDASRFDAYAAEFDAPRLYTIITIGGGNIADRAVFGRGFPGYAGFAALAVMLILLTLTKQLSESSSRLVAVRLRAVKSGGTLGFFSDAAAVLFVTLALALIAFLISPDRSRGLALSLAAYSLLMTGLCLLLSKLGGSLRIDMASPFIALVTSILGGCFADPGSLSPAFAFVSKLTPQGQLIAASGGKQAFAAVLAIEGIALLAAAFIASRGGTAFQKKRLH
ncbi:MAG: ABC transporter permease [Clostridia bacterium]|nr:ABC transporter permease [Clostridia bacterium]